MSEYIFVVPDENEPIAGESSVYYPDERDEPMQVCEEIVRCRDCEYYHDGTIKRRRYAEPHCLAIGELSCGAIFEVDENDFCSWAKRKGAES